MSLQYSSFTTAITVDSVARLISAAYFCKITYNINLFIHLCLPAYLNVLSVNNDVASDLNLLLICSNIGGTQLR